MANAKFCEMMRLVFFSATPRLFEFLDCKIKIETPKWICKKNQDCKTFRIAKKNETARHVKYDYKFARPFTTPYIILMYCTLYLDIEVIILLNCRNV